MSHHHGLLHGLWLGTHQSPRARHQPHKPTPRLLTSAEIAGVEQGRIRRLAAEARAKPALPPTTGDAPDGMSRGAAELLREEVEADRPLGHRPFVRSDPERSRWLVTLVPMASGQGAIDLESRAHYQQWRAERPELFAPAKPELVTSSVVIEHEQADPDAYLALVEREAAQARADRALSLLGPAERARVFAEVAYRFLQDRSIEATSRERCAFCEGELRPSAWPYYPPECQDCGRSVGTPIDELTGKGMLTVLLHAPGVTVTTVDLDPEEGLYTISLRAGEDERTLTTVEQWDLWKQHVGRNI